jgi:DNA-dependent RNA polymerase auxiliary subunit epsilon
MQIVKEVVSYQAEQQAVSYEIRLTDQGGCYQISCTPSIDLTRLDQLPRIEPAPLVVTLKNRDSLVETTYHRRIDYEQEKQQRSQYLDFRKQNSKWEKLPVEQRPPAPPPPHPDWDVFRAINPGAIAGYNKAIQNWSKIGKAQGEVLRLIFKLFSTFPNDTDEAMRAWKALDKLHGWKIDAGMTALQLYNPDQGKGQNRPKADALKMDNVDGFWLIELLKMIGLYHAGVTRTLQGVNDRKNYIIAPVSLSYTESNAVMEKFKSSFLTRGYGAIGSDIAALLTYVEALFDYSRERPELDWLPRKRKPRDLVAGFYTAFYKDLGNASATMNVSFLALPEWITINSSEDITLYEDLIEEIRRLTYTLDEGHSDGYNLLRSLRDFLSSGELRDLFDFTTAYAGYYVSLQEKGKFAHQLSVSFMRTIIMGIDPKLAPILEDKGFQNIAYAIRQSTVTAQYRKMYQNDRRYDIRYGLGQELARKSRYNAEFITALSEFILRYNAETVQVAENAAKSGRDPKGQRRTIQIGDINSIVSLIDQYGAPLVANLLIAYGYATTVPRKDAADQPAESFDDTADTPDSASDDSE